jgi:hypothetical protein
MELTSALICTRDRPAPLARAVRSLLASEASILKSSSSTRARSDSSTPCHRSRRIAGCDACADARGKGAALNEGLRLARGEFVACTDDDCEAAPGWVAAMVKTLAEQPTAAVVLCNVTAGPYDRTAGYVPVYVARGNRLLRSIGACRGGLGFGAGMMYRATPALWSQDTTPAGFRWITVDDDHDLCHRVLLKGWHVYETTDVSITHHGFLTFADRASAYTPRLDQRGRCMRQTHALRSRRRVSITVWLFFVYALWPPLVDVLKLRRPRQLARMAGFVPGFIGGLRMGVDRQTLMRQPGAEQR